MPPKINYGYNWITSVFDDRVSNIASSVTSKSNHDPWSDRCAVTYSDLIGRWMPVKEVVPVEKEVNADEWKEVFATSAAGS